MDELASKFTDELRASIRSRNLFRTKHSRERQKERSVSDNDLFSGLPAGSVIEEPYHPPDPKLVIQCFRQDETPFYCVLALSHPKPTLVTVCNFHNEVWEDVNGKMTRRRS